MLEERSGRRSPGTSILRSGKSSGRRRGHRDKQGLDVEHLPCLAKGLGLIVKLRALMVCLMRKKEMVSVALKISILYDHTVYT